MKPECKIDEFGNKYWYLNGKRHREDGPAVEWGNGDKAWYINGKRHREDGPAIEWANGDKCWYLNGKKLTFSKISQHIKMYCKKCNTKLQTINIMNKIDFYCPKCQR